MDLKPPAPHRLGVISNPLSGRNRRLIGRVRAILATQPGIPHIETTAADDVPRALAELAAREVDVVAINGGDGSVALALGALLADESPFATAPLLCALPGGTTNVTVNDVGIRGGLENALLGLLAWQHGQGRAAQVLERPVIGVRAATGRLLGCGLVFGAGAVVDGIEYWQEAVRARGMRSELSSGVAMARTVWGMVSGHDGFAAPVAMRLVPSRGAALEGDFMLLVISALERLFLGIHPFWDETPPGTLRMTAIERRAPRFLRALPAILRGRALPFVQSAHGYHSRRLDEVAIDFGGGFTLDGELHHLAAGESPLKVFDAGRARFLRL